MTRTEGTLPFTDLLGRRHGGTRCWPTASGGGGDPQPSDGILSSPRRGSPPAGSIAAVQRHDGMIPWFEGGHCDPWNHVESAMALSVAGFHKEATLAYQWLADTQLPDGSWFNYYLADGVRA